MKFHQSAAHLLLSSLEPRHHHAIQTMSYVCDGVVGVGRCVVGVGEASIALLIPVHGCEWVDHAIAKININININNTTSDPSFSSTTSITCAGVEDEAGCCFCFAFSSNFFCFFSIFFWLLDTFRLLWVGEVVWFSVSMVSLIWSRWLRWLRLGGWVVSNSLNVKRVGGVDLWCCWMRVFHCCLMLLTMVDKLELCVMEFAKVKKRTVEQ